MQVELGLDTFGDVTNQPDGTASTHAETIREVVAQGVAADRAGLDFFGVGEHHRPDFAVSAPEMVLAAIAARTEHIHLGSAVTVLSSDDPVRVFQRFATLDAVSAGRAEIILGRGSFTESFPLFGYEMNDYERLFEEKLGLWAALNKGGPVTWQGTVRAGLTNQEVFPTAPAGIRTWVGVGGSPSSILRAVGHGLPVTLAIIGGDPRRFLPYAQLYRDACARAGLEAMPLGIHSPGFVAETDQAARDLFFAPYKAMRDRIGRDRGWPPMARAEYEAEIDQGSLYVGGPETVARRIAATIQALGAARFDLKYSAGPLGHQAMLRCIDLYGTEVAPRVRAALTRPASRPLQNAAASAT